MTFAELLATVAHMQSKLDEAKVPYHKAICFADNGTGTSLELYPGFVKTTKTGDYKDVHLEPGSTYLEFVVE